MKVWVKVVDPWFAKSSFFSDPPRDASGDFGSFISHRKGVLAQLQSAAMAGRLEKDVSFAQGLLTVDDTVQSAVTLTYLEVCDVICLNFAGDVRYFLCLIHIIDTHSHLVHCCRIKLHRRRYWYHQSSSSNGCGAMRNNLHTKAQWRAWKSSASTSLDLCIKGKSCLIQMRLFVLKVID